MCNYLDATLKFIQYIEDREASFSLLAVNCVRPSLG